MPKWDIDRALKALEPETVPGTSIGRTVMDIAIMRKEGVQPTREQVERGSGNIWCIGLGFAHRPKAFFYGQTIRDAFLRARKAAKAEQFAAYTPWGVQDFQPAIKKQAVRRRDEKKKPRRNVNT